MSKTDALNLNLSLSDAIVESVIHFARKNKVSFNEALVLLVRTALDDHNFRRAGNVNLCAGLETKAQRAEATAAMLNKFIEAMFDLIGSGDNVPVDCRYTLRGLYELVRKKSSRSDLPKWTAFSRGDRYRIGRMLHEMCSGENQPARSYKAVQSNGVATQPETVQLVWLRHVDIPVEKGRPQIYELATSFRTLDA